MSVTVSTEINGVSEETPNCHWTTPYSPPETVSEKEPECLSHLFRQMPLSLVQTDEHRRVTFSSLLDVGKARPKIERREGLYGFPAENDNGLSLVSGTMGGA